MPGKKVERSKKANVALERVSCTTSARHEAMQFMSPCFIYKYDPTLDKQAKTDLIEKAFALLLRTLSASFRVAFGNTLGELRKVLFCVGCGDRKSTVRSFLVVHSSRSCVSIHLHV